MSIQESLLYTKRKSLYFSKTESPTSSNVGMENHLKEVLSGENPVFKVSPPFSPRTREVSPDTPHH